MGADIIEKFTVVDPLTRAKNITKNVYMSEEIMKEMRRWWCCVEKYKEEIEKSMKISEDLKKIEEMINKNEELLIQFLK